MRLPVLLFIMIISTNVFSQSKDVVDVKATIETFFEGFHTGDTTLMKSVMIPKVMMQTAFIDKEGNGRFVDDGGPDKLLNAIAKRTADEKWDERLTSFNIQIDANMAHAWVDYEFWFNNKFSHCGVNSFQLVKTNATWKIISLIDSRKRADCTLSQD